MDRSEDTLRHRVVINHEGQYSILPETSPIPSGWKETNRVGTKRECLAYIEEVWTDLRPLSLQNKMDAKKGK